jgi:hypothetical protein
VAVELKTVGTQKVESNLSGVPPTTDTTDGVVPLDIAFDTSDRVSWINLRNDDEIAVWRELLDFPKVRGFEGTDSTRTVVRSNGVFPLSVFDLSDVVVERIEVNCFSAFESSDTTYSLGTAADNDLYGTFDAPTSIGIVTLDLNNGFVDNTVTSENSSEDIKIYRNGSQNTKGVLEVIVHWRPAGYLNDGISGDVGLLYGGDTSSNQTSSISLTTSSHVELEKSGSTLRLMGAAAVSGGGNSFRAGGSTLFVGAGTNTEYANSGNGITYHSLTTLFENQSGKGDLTIETTAFDGCSNGTLGFFCTGVTVSPSALTDDIDFVQLSTLAANASSKAGDTLSRLKMTVMSNKESGFIVGGLALFSIKIAPVGTPTSDITKFDLTTIDSGSSVGSTTSAHQMAAAASNEIIGLIVGGRLGSSSLNTITYIDLVTNVTASRGVDTLSRWGATGLSNGQYAFVTGGSTGNEHDPIADSTRIDFVTFTSNAVANSDLTTIRSDASGSS